MRQFEHQVKLDHIDPRPERWLYKLNPFVVHATPIIQEPGEMRSFVKVSVSKHRYNLVGNSHNYLFDYEWEMFERTDVRNDPTYAQADYYEVGGVR
jgi:hypothetical protein